MKFQEFEQVVCEVVRYQIQKHLSRELTLLRNLELKSWMDQHARSVVVELTSVALAKHRKEETGWVSYPADWWEALKERWFPKWMLRRWPVKYTKRVVEQTVYHCCPHMDIEARSNHVKFLQQVERGK